MKKFLSLALALIMTLSLVTISAGATEYKDLTDKDEIQYEEAVAVLNRLGIITGYSEGDFRPQGELTRGAAAKILVSLLIGSEAAEALPVTGNPYPDVPAGNTFAGVISYCKNMHLIDGYPDGTFRPLGTLSGYAFSKMLLGALGYDGKQEGGFTGAGWTTNVAALGHEANLFDRINFNGGETVNRETACQLALNTLKATEVQYVGGMDVTVGDTQLNAPKTRTFKTSNQEWASHIDSRRAGYQWTAHGSQQTNVNDSHYTVEFGEEHFKDLRMDHDRNTHDQFGRPANVWSYKKVTIGTFSIEPDFVYTTQVAHNVATTTSAAKVRALELNGYDLDADTASVSGQKYTNLWLNGKWYSADDKDADATLITDEKDLKKGDTDNYLTKVADIADYTDNGTLVEVYVDDADADFIRDVVVIKTQLMEVRSQKSESVALKLYDDASDADGKIIYGYNQKPIDKAVNDVELNDDLYASLKDKKVGDIVAVVPVWADSETKYDVADAYTPETVSGVLTRVDSYGNVPANVTSDGYKENDGRGVISATVGGTEYKVALWNKDLYDIDGASIRVTRKDVTLYMDVYGNAMLAKDVGATSNFMIVGGYHSGLVNGRVVTYADGWDINGNEISLNLGNHSYVGDLADNGDSVIGDLVHYSSATDSSYAEWRLDYLGVYDVASLRGGEAVGTETEEYSLRASNGRVLLNGWEWNDTRTSDGKTIDINNNKSYKGNDTGSWGLTSKATANVETDDAGIKFIYVTRGDDGEVDSIEIKNGMQATAHDEILGEGSRFAHKRAQACVSLKNSNTEVNGESVIKAVVIKQDSSSANLSNLVYIHNYAGSAGRSTDNQGRIVYGYEVKFIGTSNWDETKTIYSYKNLSIGDFARARKASEVPTEVQGVTEDNFYVLNGYDPRTNVALSVSKTGQINTITPNNKTLLELKDYYSPKESPANISSTWPIDKDLDVGDKKADNIVSIAHAKILDLTGNDVENATDLKDLWNDVTDKQKADKPGCKRVIEIAMLYNDKRDDDEFRDVYMLIIRRADEDKTYVPTVNTDESAKVEFVYTGTATAADVTTSSLTGLEIGDTFTLTLLNGATATVTGGTLKDGVVTVEAKTVTVTVNKAETPADSHKITVTVDGVEDATLSKTVKNGEAAEIIYTVPAGKTATYKIGDAAEVAVPADGKITVPAGDADVTVAIVTTTIPAGFQVVIANSAKGDATAAGIHVEKKDDSTITISGMPENNEQYKVNVVLNGASQASSLENGDLAYTAGAVVYIQKAKSTFGLDGDVITVIYTFDDAGDFGSLASVQNATPWTSTGEFTVLTMKGEDFLTEKVTTPRANGTLKTGYRIQPTKLTAIVKLLNESPDGVEIDDIKTSNIGFSKESSVKDDSKWVEVNYPLTAGKPAFNLKEGMDIDVIKGELSVQPHSSAYVVTVNGEKVTTWKAVKPTDVVAVEKAKPVEDDTVRAVLQRDGEYDLYVYGATRVLTDDEVKQAVEAASGETIKEFNSATGAGRFTDNHPFKVNTTSPNTQMAPGRLYKMTILDKTSYMYSGEAITLPAGVAAVVRVSGSNDDASDARAFKNVDAGGDENVIVNNATDCKVPTFTGEVSEEQVYVEAVKFDTAQQGRLAPQWDIWYIDGAGNAKVVNTSSANMQDYVVKGLAVTIATKRPIAAKAGLQANFIVDGEVESTKTFSGAGNVTSDEIILGTPKNPASGLKIEVKDGIKVSLDGQDLGVFSVGDKVSLDEYIKYPNAYIFVQKTDGKPEESEKSEIDPYKGTIYTVDASDKLVGGEIVLNSYVQIAVADDDFIAYVDEDCREAIGAINTTTAQYNYVRAGSDVYFKASAGTTTKRPVENAFLEAAVVADRKIPALTEVSPASFHSEGVWKLAPVENVLSGDYVIGVKLPGESKAEDNKWEITPTTESSYMTEIAANQFAGLSQRDKFTVEWVEKDVALELSGKSLIYKTGSVGSEVMQSLTLDEPEMGSTGKITLTVAPQSSGTLAKPANDINGRVRVNVEHNGETYFFEIDVTVKA